MSYHYVFIKISQSTNIADWPLHGQNFFEHSSTNWRAPVECCRVLIFAWKFVAVPSSSYPWGCPKNINRVSISKKRRWTQETDRGDKDCDRLTENRNILRPLCYISDQHANQFFVFRETNNNYAVRRIFRGIFCFFFFRSIWIVRHGDFIFKSSLSPMIEKLWTYLS